VQLKWTQKSVRKKHFRILREKNKHFAKISFGDSYILFPRNILQHSFFPTQDAMVIRENKGKIIKICVSVQIQYAERRFFFLKSQNKIHNSVDNIKNDLQMGSCHFQHISLGNVSREEKLSILSLLFVEWKLSKI